MSRAVLIVPLVKCRAPGCPRSYRPNLEQRGGCSNRCVEILRELNQLGISGRIQPALKGNA